MTTSNKIISAIVLSTSLLAGWVSASIADDSQTIKPLQAISFNIGEKHGVGYFMQSKDSCDVVVTLASASNGDLAFEATRHEVSVPAGQIGRFNADDAVLEFNCLTGGGALKYRSSIAVASAE